eukprot:TRINITY_DN360_c10_g3_i2.p1 TRINITY_DN360_c10_g3~~TRINITY_DN360_c10_g3_i2.p1  ORF type:complete len:457 (+),score=127.17 TRINITY_DN360_c10_g3_i2:308-1678(+)
MHVIATAPHLYSEFVQLKAHDSIMSLLIHENTDITVDAIDLIREMIDSDVYEENPEEVQQFIEILVENQIIELLVSNLNRLRESDSDEKQGVFNVLSIIESLIEAKLELCDVIGEKTEFLSWILKRIQARDFDDVKQYCGEILSILLQTSKKNQIKVGKLNGIDILLTSVARYKKSNPATKAEEELLENLFNCLCVLCPVEENKKFFLQAEGLKLVQIFIKNKFYARKCALKLLDYVLANDVQNCRRWVQLPALGTLFAAFMKKGAAKHKKGFSDNEDDEHVISCVASLLKLFDSEEQGKYFSRVVDKFREKDYEKVERLLELHEKYIQRVKAVDLKIAKEKSKDDMEDDDEALEDSHFLQRLDAGLFTLQLVDYVIAQLCNANSNVKEKVRQLLNIQGSSFGEVKKILEEYSKNIGDSNTSEEQVEREKSRLLTLGNNLVESPSTSSSTSSTTSS